MSRAGLSLAPRWIGLLALAAVIATGAVLLLFADSGGRAARGRVQPDTHGKPSTSEREVAPQPTSERFDEDARNAVAKPLLAGRVHDEVGVPVVGAEVTWSLIPDRDERWLVRDGSFAAIARAASVRASSDASGRFAFFSAPGDATDGRGILWATHPDFEANALSLPLANTVHAPEPTLQLTRRPGCTIAVVDAQGRPLSNALVEHVALPDTTTASVDLRADEQRRAFYRQAQTNSDGRARLSVLSGLQSFVASHAGLRSPAHVALAPFGETIVLRCGASFTARGLVRFVDGQPNDSAMLVIVRALTGKRAAELAAVEVARDGSWGPIALPCVTERDLQFELTGGGLIPALETRPAPAPGAVVVVDFRAFAGRTMRVLVVDDEQGEPIAGARVRVSSMLDNVDWRHAFGTTGADGVASVDGCTTATGVVAATAQGHVKRSIGPAELGEPTDDPFEIRLPRGGRIAGRVTHAGEPVQDFELVYWRDSAYPIQSRDFLRRTDGRFELDEVELGVITLIASSVDLPATAPMQVSVTPDAVAQVELELPPGNRARGCVVDALDGRPVPTAKVQLWTHWGARMLTRRGSPHGVDEHGQFELDGFGSGAVQFMVEAPGYANWLATATITSGQTLELGTIAIVRRQTLSLQLAAPAIADLADCTYFLRGLEFHPTAHFDERGRASVANVAPGECRLVVEAPDGSGVTQALVLAAGRDWHVDIDLSGPAELLVELRARDGSSIPPGLAVKCVDAVSRGRNGGIDAFVSDAGTARLQGLAAGGAVVTVTDLNFANYAVERVDLQPGENRLSLDVDRPGARVRIVDREGAPIAGVEATVCAPSLSSTWLMSFRTDELGVFQMPRAPCTTFVMSAFHALHGFLSERELELDFESSEPVEVVLDAQARLRVTCRDGDFVPAALQLRISDRHGVLFYKRLSTESDGSLVWGLVSESDFVVEVAHPGYWPTRQLVRATQDGPAETMQVRRLGSLSLRARSAASGQALSGVACSIESLEFTHDVGAWLAAGQVRASAANMSTDATGVLRIDGLPHGEYRWRVGGVEGFAVVPPHASAAVDVVVP